jgi:hypothetical protein
MHVRNMEQAIVALRACQMAARQGEVAAVRDWAVEAQESVMALETVLERAAWIPWRCSSHCLLRLVSMTDQFLPLSRCAGLPSKDWETPIY